MKILDYKDQIVVASKYFNSDEMIKIYHLGLRNFGENYVNDLLTKKQSLSHLNDIKWHLIGHLQTNKVKKIINEIDYLHTLDSEKLAKEIQKYRIMPLNCLIQLNLEENDQKSGIFINQLDDLMKSIEKYDKINLIGLMTIGTINDLEKTEAIFKELASLKSKYNFKVISMGMSQDYEIALKYHSDFLRIGSLFKEVI